MSNARYLCGHCGAELSVGARWCRACLKGTGSAIHVAEREAVVPVTPEQVMDPTPLWPDQRPATGQRAINEHQRFAPPEFSRWKKGATTFGPTVKVAITVLMVVWLLAVNPLFWIAGIPIAGIVLVSIWRRDRVDTSSMPFKESARQTADSFRRDRTQRRLAARTFEVPRVVCAACGAWREDAERVCYRCRGELWRTTDPKVTEAYAICGGCGISWTGERSWCTACNAPRSGVLWVQPSTPHAPRVETIKPPRLMTERSRWKKGVTTFGPVTKIAVTAAFLGTGVALYLAPDKMGGAMFPAYLAIALLGLWAIWRKDEVARPKKG